MNASTGTNIDEIRRFEAYVEADPKNSLLWINLGDRYHSAGRLDEAIACFEKCLMLDESNMVARGRLANALITQHRFGEAERILRGIMDATREDPVLLHNLGLTLFYQERFDEAQRAFEKARDAGLRAPKNLAYIVYSLHKRNDMEAARRAAETWLEESPGPATEGYVSMLEFDQGDMDAARARAERVLQLQPENPDANVVLGAWQLEQQNASQALEHYRHVVDVEPDNPRGLQGLALAHLHRRKYPEALEALERAKRCAPRNGTNHLIAGWAKLASGDARGAEQAFREAVHVNRNFGEAHGGVATALVFQNRLDEARTEASKALRLDPKGFGAVFAEALRLELQGKNRSATKMLGKMLEQAPLPRSKPLIEHIQEHMRSRHPSTSTLKDTAK